MKYFGINLTKYTRCFPKLQTLIKEIKNNFKNK